jgi:hypothetical protein
LSNRRSPKEESLEFALQTRKNILERKSDAVSALRACLIIATNLNKKVDENWITKELDGYLDNDSIPSYRIVDCRYATGRTYSLDYEKVNVPSPTPRILSFKERGVQATLAKGFRSCRISLTDMEAILAAITTRCLMFLNNTINELQFGGIVENLMEEIRKKTDSKLGRLDSKINGEIESLCVNLASDNPADWNKVGHSCRNILRLLADKLFPPKDEPYLTTNGKALKVLASNVINRLCAFLDQKFSGEERKFLIAEIKYLQSYLHQINWYTQKAEHSLSVQKFDADMVAIHTYLIISEILRFVPEQAES